MTDLEVVLSSFPRTTAVSNTNQTVYTSPPPVSVAKQLFLVILSWAACATEKNVLVSHMLTETLPIAAQSQRKPLEMVNSNERVSSRRNRTENGVTSANSQQQQSNRPGPLHTTDLGYNNKDMEEIARENGTKKGKPRSRSISPHARAILRRTFSRSRSRSGSRSRSRSRKAAGAYDDDDSSIGSNSSAGSRSRNSGKQMLVAVTSCRSDAYYSQKAPGAISMLPRKAPSALKIFHELAVGMKDAYDAVGATPVKPDEDSDGFQRMTDKDKEGTIALWRFMVNIDFVSFSS